MAAKNSKRRKKTGQRPANLVLGTLRAVRGALSGGRLRWPKDLFTASLFLCAFLSSLRQSSSAPPPLLKHVRGTRAGSRWRPMCVFQRRDEERASTLPSASGTSESIAPPFPTGIDPVREQAVKAGPSERGYSPDRESARALAGMPHEFRDGNTHHAQDILLHTAAGSDGLREERSGSRQRLDPGHRNRGPRIRDTWRSADNHSGTGRHDGPGVDPETQRQRCVPSAQ